MISSLGPGLAVHELDVIAGDATSHVRAGSKRTKAEPMTQGVMDISTRNWGLLGVDVISLFLSCMSIITLIEPQDKPVHLMLHQV